MIWVAGVNETADVAGELVEEKVNGSQSVPRELVQPDNV